MPIIQLRPPRKARSLIVFVHGFTGSAASTWTSFANYIAEAAELSDWDMYGFEYRTSPSLELLRRIWASEPRISTIATQFEAELTVLINSAECERIAIVAHSMGGLVAQRAIIDSDIFQKLLKSFICLGTPSDGIDKARRLSFLKDQLADMEPGSQFIKSLRRDWKNAGFLDAPPFTFWTIAGDKDDFVPVASSLSPFPHRFQSVTSGDHKSMLSNPTEVVRNTLVRSLAYPQFQFAHREGVIRSLILNVDRESPDSAIETEISRHRTGSYTRPYLFFFSAESDDLPGAYLERLRIITLPRIMARKYLTIPLLPIRWPSSFRKDDVSGWLGTALGQHLGIPANDVTKTVASRDWPLIISSDMSIADWSDLIESLVKQFSDYWRNLPDLKAAVFILVCLRSDQCRFSEDFGTKLRAAAKFDQHLRGDITPALDVLDRLYLGSLHLNHALFQLQGLSVQERTSLQAALTALSQSSNDLRLRELEDFLTTELSTVEVEVKDAK